MTDDINMEEERMNKDVNGNEYIFSTPSDLGTVTGVWLPLPNGKGVYRKIDPESGDLKLATDVPK